MLFRLKITTSSSDVTTVVLNYPDKKLLDVHLDNIGDEGYYLYEILTALVPDGDIVQILEENTIVTDEDSIIHSNLILKKN